MRDPRSEHVEQNLQIDFDDHSKQYLHEYICEMIIKGLPCLIWIKSWAGCPSEEVEQMKSIMKIDESEFLEENCWFLLELTNVETLRAMLSITIDSIFGWCVYVHCKTTRQILFVWESEIVDVWCCEL